MLLTSQCTCPCYDPIKAHNCLYPNHAEALRKAKLAPDQFPTLHETLDDLDERKKKNEAKEEEEKKRNHQTYFCIGMTNYWCAKKRPVHVILKTL